MRKKQKSISKAGKLLCLMLVVVLTLGAMPVYGTFASAGTDEPTVETASETPMPSVEPDTPEPVAVPAPQGEPEATPTPSAEVTPSGEPEASPTPGETPTESPEPSESAPATYENSISGTLWLDMFDDIGNSVYAGDGTRQAEESLLAGYKVSLFKADDLSSAVASTKTGADGKYSFENIEPGSYVVGVKTTTMDGVEYLLPLFWLDGTTGDNRFVATYDTSADAYLYAYTAPITVAEDSEVTGMDAGMRTVPGIQPMADYTIDMSTVSAGGTGYTYASNVLTFTTAANSHTYTITGTTTTKRIVVAPGVTLNVTLDGVSITHATLSPFELQGSANVSLTLAAGTTNTLTCSATTGTTYVSRAGLTVPGGTTLTIQGTGTLNATGGVYGAGIGGYGYYDSVSAFAGTSAGIITIAGGTVTATGGNTSAGIGGGGYSYNGGTITINGGMVTATGTNYGGAGIGGGSSGNNGGTIIINDGEVTATGGNNGAGIGGGAANSSGGGNGGNITIAGGTVTANGTGNGAGIGGGSGGNLSGNPGGAGGVIKIIGGTVTATGGVLSNGGSGIGGGGNTGSAATSVEIAASATVKAYSGGSARPAIWATSITGTGYYFNGYLTNGAISTTDTTELKLYTTSSNTSYDSLFLPADYTCFAYTTGGSSETTNIRAYNSSSTPIGAVVYTSNNSQNIISAIASTTLQQVKFMTIPVLGTVSASNVTDTTADLTSTGHSFTAGTMDAATAYYYNTSDSFTGSHPTINWTAPGASPYTESLTGLNSNTMYYYQVYLKNEYGDITSVTQTFVTLPQISSWSPSATGSTTATVSGNIVASANGQAITGVKVAYDTSNTFTSPTTVTLTSGEFSDTSFSTSLTGLTSGITYYVKVEVTNAGGTTTSTVQQFRAGLAVTEKFVDLSGSAVDVTGLPDNTVFVTGSYTALGIPTSHTAGGNTYTYLGYKLDSYTTGDALTSGTPSAVTITGNRDVYYVYAIAEGSIKIEKYAHDGTTLLPDAEFRLEKLTGPGGMVDTTFTAQTLTTGAGGSVTFANLSAGSYRITETKAPAGHELLTAAFEADIPKDITYAVGIPPADNSYLYSTTSGSNVIYHYYDVTYKVSDQASIAMPAAGAAGTFPPYALWGGGLILLAALGGGILWTKRRRAYAPKQG